jgi:type II secretory pathway pseudopilin PulG
MSRPARSRLRRFRRQHGAALLLLLMVAGVGAASLLISALSGGRMDVVRERRTLATMAQARDALIGYALTHGRLPRPARSATDGRETAQPCADEAACTGFLPWTELGVDGIDSWGKVLRYSVTPVYTRNPILVAEAVADKRVSRRNSDGTPYYLVGQAACSLAAQCAPAVILSSGRYNLGTSAQGVVQANGASGNIDELQNNNGSNNFVSRPASDDPQVAGGQFDDLVTWIPQKLFYLRLAAAGQLF